MTLLELLVNELHKYGGWPDGAVECQRFVDEANIDFYDENGNWDDDCFLTYGAIAAELVRKRVVSCDHEQVTFDEYQSALAASQKVEWVDGLPPVGCECERSWCGDEWIKCHILFISNETVVVKLDTREAAYGISEVKFRQIRTEAERKRDYVISTLTNYTLRGDACDIYDAIAACKIPGVKLED